MKVVQIFWMILLFFIFRYIPQCKHISSILVIFAHWNDNHRHSSRFTWRNWLTIDLESWTCYSWLDCSSWWWGLQHSIWILEVEFNAELTAADDCMSSECSLPPYTTIGTLHGKVMRLLGFLVRSSAHHCSLHLKILAATNRSASLPFWSEYEVTMN